MTGKGSTPADEMLQSSSLKIRGGTPAQEMGLGKRHISVIMDKQEDIKCKDREVVFHYYGRNHKY